MLRFRTIKRAGRSIGLGSSLLLSVVVSIVGLGEAARAGESMPAGLRITSLNIAGLTKWDSFRYLPRDAEQATEYVTKFGEDPSIHAERLIDAYDVFLNEQADDAERRGEAMLFALTEAIGETSQGPCKYLGAPEGSVELGSVFLDPETFDSFYQGFPCDYGPGGHVGDQGNEFLTNAEVGTIADHRTLDFLAVGITGGCHKLGAQLLRAKFGPGPDDWMWIANAHLSLVPSASVAQFEAILGTLRDDLPPGDWESRPIVVVGDFNLVREGWDEDKGGLGWDETQCDQNITSTMHATQSEILERHFAENGFEHVGDPTQFTARSWARTRTIDYAVIRNAPAGDWSYGHLYHPLSGPDSDRPDEYWTDHLGYQVIVRHPPVDQVWWLSQ